MQISANGLKKLMEWDDACESYGLKDQYVLQT